MSLRQIKFVRDQLRKLNDTRSSGRTDQKDRITKTPTSSAQPSSKCRCCGTENASHELTAPSPDGGHYTIPICSSDRCERTKRVELEKRLRLDKLNKF